MVCSVAKNWCETRHWKIIYGRNVNFTLGWDEITTALLSGNFIEEKKSLTRSQMPRESNFLFEDIFNMKEQFVKFFLMAASMFKLKIVYLWKHPYL